MNKEARLAQLEIRIQEMEDWKELKKRQQLSSPLDKISDDIVHKDMLLPGGVDVSPIGLLTIDSIMNVIINGKIRRIPSQFIEF